MRTGTNFLVRAKAFMEAGGSPTYTLTEDFALGMEMAKWGWRCRYVQEYLAIGEAPTEIRNCFQQRSRWTKGVRVKDDNGKHTLRCKRLQPAVTLANPCQWQLCRAGGLCTHIDRLVMGCRV